MGISTNPDQRFKDHIANGKNPTDTKYNYPLYRWMRKHFFNVTFEVLEEVGDKDYLHWSEIKWIQILRERGHRLLNQTDGGVATLGWTPSPEVRAKWSKTRRERKTSVGTNNGMYGRNHTPETRKLQSALKKGRPSNNKGKPMSEEQKSKISKTKKENPGPANHTRWHVNRGVTSTECMFC